MMVVGQFAKSAARLLRVAGLLFLKVTRYRKLALETRFWNLIS